MAHELSEIVAKHGKLAYRVETRRPTRGIVTSTLYELQDMGNGFLGWLPFGGWREVLATGGRIATEKAVAKCHARGMKAAPSAIEKRREYLRFVTEYDEKPTHCAQCAEERGVACPAPGTCTHEEGADQ